MPSITIALVRRVLATASRARCFSSSVAPRARPRRSSNCASTDASIAARSAGSTTGADRPDLILQPWDLLDLIPLIARLKERSLDEGFFLSPATNIGYFGPEETRLRSLGHERNQHWRGCQAGRAVLGIESDGAVKGCPSLQTAHYVGGNILQLPLQEIWEHSPELAFTRERTVDDLWGFCRSCEFASACLAGCTFTAQALLGRRGNNPWCHYRARDFAKRGLRERLVPKDAAPGLPFDNGRFELVVEPLDAPDPPPEKPGRRLRVWKGEVGA
jgi:radical SAM protein with 4Fe4S-binding SPASM domain